MQCIPMPRIPPPESRAPPPSPVAGAYSGQVFDWPEDNSDEKADNDELSDFLAHSIRVPKLNFPYRLFPQAPVRRDPPEIDLRSLGSPESGGRETVRSAAVEFGCFQLVNHDVAAEVAAAGAAARWPENGEEEEVVWWFGSGGNEVVAPNLNGSYNDMSGKMKNLRASIEEIANRVAAILLEGMNDNSDDILAPKSGDKCVDNGPTLCLQRHHKIPSNDSELQHELLRVLMRSWRCSSALTLHIPIGASEFHVYSKRTWLRFRPKNSAIIVTVGDRIQEMCNGVYKHVIGKPGYSESNENESIAVAFHYTNPSSARSHAHTSTRGEGEDEEKIISIAQQIKIATMLAILYHFLLLLCCNS